MRSPMAKKTSKKTVTKTARAGKRETKPTARKKAAFKRAVKKAASKRVRPVHVPGKAEKDVIPMKKSPKKKVEKAPLSGDELLAKIQAARAKGERVNVIGEAKAKLKERVVAYCAEPRTYAEIYAFARVTDAQTRYLLRALMYERLIVKSGVRENTVYQRRRAS